MSETATITNLSEFYAERQRIARRELVEAIANADCRSAHHLGLTMIKNIYQKKHGQTEEAQWYADQCKRNSIEIGDEYRGVY